MGEGEGGAHGRHSGFGHRVSEEGVRVIKVIPTNTSTEPRPRAETGAQPISFRRTPREGRTTQDDFILGRKPLRGLDPRAVNLRLRTEGRQTSRLAGQRSDAVRGGPEKQEGRGGRVQLVERALSWDLAP